MESPTFGISACALLILAGSAVTRAARAEDTQADARPALEVTPPVPVDTTVAYPDGATGDARVILQITVDADGTVSDSVVMEGAEPFAKAARVAALSWRFEPAVRGNKPIKVRIRFAAQFVGEHVVTPVETKNTAPSATESARAPSPPPSQEYTVTVHGERAAPGGMSLSRADARMLPSAFGDPFRTVETLAGVTPVVSVIPFFFIRGAPPGNVGFYVDGIRVPLLFHALAGPAVLPPSLIDRIDVYEGGYPARFGRYAGAIVSAETVTPTDELHAEGRISVLDTSATVKTPFADGKGQLFVSGRAFYPGHLAVAGFTNADLNYWDYQLLSSYDLSRSDTVGIFAFGAFDHVGDDTGVDLAGTQFHRMDLRYDHVFAAGTKARVAVTLGYDHSESTGGDITDRSIAARTEIEQRLGGAGSLRLGFDANFDDYLLSVTDPTANFRDATSLFPSRLDAVTGAYADFSLKPERWLTVRPGLRADVFFSEGQARLAVDPRLSAEFGLSKRVKLIDAFGIAHQTPNFIPNLPGAQVGGFSGGLQETAQYSSGVELALPEDVTTSVTLYESTFFNLSDPLGFSGNIGFNADSASVRSLGSGFGAEFMIRRAFTRRLGGLASYTLSRSVRSRASIDSLSAFDRTHVANVALGYDLGHKWRVGIRGLYASGVPTRTITVDGPRYGGDRAPGFFRLDLRVEKRFRLGRTGYWSLTADVQNVTASTEVTERVCNVIRCTTAAVGPLVLPNVGVEAGF